MKISGREAAFQIKGSFVFLTVASQGSGEERNGAQTLRFLGVFNSVKDTSVDPPLSPDSQTDPKGCHYL